MADYRRNEIVTGLFIFAAVGVLALFAFRIGGFDLMGVFKGQVLVARSYFTDVRALSEGTVVVVGGRPVGHVVALRLVDSADSQGAFPDAPRRQLIEVEFELEDPTLRLHPATATVALAQSSVLSAHFLSLDPGRWSDDDPAPLIFESGLKDGVLIPSRESPGLGELFATVQSVTQRAGEFLVEAEAKFLSDENAGSVRRLLVDLEGAARSSREAIGRLNSLLNPDEDPRVDGILRNLAEATDDLSERIDTVQSELQDSLGAARAVITENRAEVSEAVRRLRQAAWHAELALRKIRSDPSVVLFGDNETDYEATPYDETFLRESGRAKPYQQRDESD